MRGGSAGYQRGGGVTVRSGGSHARYGGMQFSAGGQSANHSSRHLGGLIALLADTPTTWREVTILAGAVTFAMASISRNTILMSIVAGSAASSALAITTIMATTREGAVGCIAGR